MKTLFTLLLSIVLSTISSSPVLAQCAFGDLPLTISYDTTVFGSGNTSRTITFPQFQPSTGTLIAASISLVSKLQYSYTLENTWFTPQTYKTHVVRSDDIYSSALDPQSIDNTKNSDTVINVLLPGHQINYGPAVLNSFAKDSVTDSRLINFEGIGTVGFDFETGTYQITQNSTHYNFNFTSSTDTSVFKIIYYYCPNGLLSSDLLQFSAIPQSNNNVLLNWHQATVQADRIYGVQVSTDGITFSNLADVSENTSGFYTYNYLNNNDAKKLFFRIQEKNASGEIKYSNISMVTFSQDGKTGVTIYPTLYTGGNLQVNFPEKSDWQITMYASDGRKVAESRQNDVSGVSFPVAGSLGNGIYIVETFNTHSQQRNINRIVIQR